MSFEKLISQDEKSEHLRFLMRDDKILAPKGCSFLVMLEKRVLRLGPQVADLGFPGDPTLPEDIEDAYVRRFVLHLTKTSDLFHNLRFKILNMFLFVYDMTLLVVAAIVAQEGEENRNPLCFDLPALS